MRIHLMFVDKSFNKDQEETWNAKALIKDLDLEPILDAMAQGDTFIKEVATKALISGVTKIEDIRYRQDAMKDVIRNPKAIREAYRVLTEVFAKIRSMWILNSDRSPDSSVFYSVRILEMHLDGLDKIREIFLQNESGFTSKAFLSLIEALKHFDREYIGSVKENLALLEFPNGLSVKVTLGREAELSQFRLLKPAQKSGLTGLLSRMGGGRRYSWSLPPRDESGGQEIENIKNLSLERVAKVLRVASKHVEQFMESLRIELGFYVGSLNLWDRLKQIGAPLCFPTPLEQGTLRFNCLVESALALRKQGVPVCNSLDSNARHIILVSGANRGGKTVFLRSIGQAQLMMMCGMFVTAEKFESSISTGIFTHFKVDEEANLKKGRLEEEIERMSLIVQHVRPGSIVFMNESFSSTNEREGSEIARQVVCALADLGVKVLYVTHFYEIQMWLAQNRALDTVFLRAERKEDGTRTYRIVPEEPKETSYAEDVYRKVFGQEI